MNFLEYLVVGFMGSFFVIQASIIYHLPLWSMLFIFILLLGSFYTKAGLLYFIWNGEKNDRTQGHNRHKIISSKKDTRRFI